eukprot:scaffold182858_cov36-Tisochrysis_lutea.AAC.3
MENDTNSVSFAGRLARVDRTKAMRAEELRGGRVISAEGVERHDVMGRCATRFAEAIYPMNKTTVGVNLLRSAVGAQALP